MLLIKRFDLLCNSPLHDFKLVLHAPLFIVGIDAVFNEVFAKPVENIVAAFDLFTWRIQPQAKLNNRDVASLKIVEFGHIVSS